MANRAIHKSQHASPRYCYARSLLVALSLLAILAEAGITEGSEKGISIAGLSPRDSLFVADGKGRALYSLNEKEPRIPASTLKILTALAALRNWGESFRFETTAYLDDSKNIYLKGWGDPMLISEVIEEMSHALSKRLTMIRDIILDDTFFERGVRVPGAERSTNPYDAPLGALCANFNTVFFETGEMGQIISAEPQTPIVDFARKRIKKSRLPQGRHSFMNDSGEPSLYFGHLLAHFLKNRGIPVTGKIVIGTVPSIPPVYVHSSKFTLIEVLHKMMEFSNNFIANQLAVTLGARLYGTPGTIEKASRVLSSFGKGELGLTSLKVQEGSGISRGNQISSADMVKLLNAFEPYKGILKRRDEIFYKSGTLRSIQARAGYIHRPGKGLEYFAIFLEKSLLNIDDIMDAIAKGY